MQMQRTISAVMMGLLSWFTVIGGSTAAAEQPLAYDPLVTRGTLPNGVRYVIRENGKPANRLELRLVVNAGSVLETDDQQGLAHFLEHMAFNGTEHFEKQELVDYLESIGMAFGPDLNAYTSFDETVYMLQVPTDDEAVLEKAFLILRDWAEGLTLVGEEIEKERGVVIEEWRLGRGAMQRLRDKHFPVLFHDSRYASRLPIGKLEVLQEFEHDRLRAYYEDWYRPELMAVVAVGDVPPARVEAWIRQYFADVPAEGRAPPRPAFPVPDHPRTLVSVATDAEATQSSFSVYYKHPVAPLQTRGDYRRRIKEGLFTAMLNQRLDELRTRPNPPFLSAYAFKGRFVRTKDLFGLGATVEDNGIERGLQAVLTEAERVRRHGFTASEFERAKAERLRAMQVAYNERRTTESKRYAGEYVDDLLHDTVSPGVEAELQLHQAILPDLAVAELNDLAEEWVTTTNRVILVSGPDKPGIRLPDQDELLAVFEQVAQADIAPYEDNAPDGPLVAEPPPPGSVVARDHIEELGVTRWTLSNGIRVHLKPTEFKSDEVLFSAFSPGGHSLSSLENFIPASSAADAMQVSGVDDLSRVQLEKALAGKVVSVSPYIDALREGLEGSCSPEDLETLLELVYLRFTAPRADEEAFAAYQDRTRASLANRLAEPAAVFADRMTEVLSQDHPRRRPWKPETVEAMDLEDSLGFYQDRFEDANDFDFLFVGRFDPDTLQPLVERYLGSLPVREGDEQWVDHDIEPPPGSVEVDVHKGVDPKSRVHMVWHGPLEWTYAQRIQVNAMLDALNIRLRETVREDLGGTYSIYAYAKLQHYPAPRYQIHLTFGCAPHQAEPLIAAVEAEIARLSDEPLDAATLTKVKQTMVRQREINLKKNSFWQYVLQFYTWHGEDPRTLLEFDRLVEALHPEQIRETAAQYFGTPNQAVFRLFPEGEEWKSGVIGRVE